jgi:hypothetical protein
MTLFRWLIGVAFTVGLGCPGIAAPPTPTLAVAEKTNLSEVTQAFGRLAKLKEIPWNYPIDGCYARAERAVEFLDELGFRPKKVWAFPSGPDPLWVATTRAPKGFVEWSYHVAPVLPMRLKNGKLSDYVLDPALFDRPVPVREWAAAMKRSADSPAPFTYVGLPTEAPTLPTGKKALGNGYWPGPDPKVGIDEHVTKTLERYNLLAAKVKPTTPATRPEKGEPQVLVKTPTPNPLLGNWVASNHTKDGNDVFTLWRFSPDGSFKVVIVGFETVEPKVLTGKFEFTAGSPSKLVLHEPGVKDATLSVADVSANKVELELKGGSFHLTRAGK